MAPTIPVIPYYPEDANAYLTLRRNRAQSVSGNPERSDTTVLYIYGFVVLFAVVAPAVLTLAFKSEDRQPWLIATALGLVLAISVPGYFSYPVAHHYAKQAAVGGYPQTLQGSLLNYGIEPFTCTENGPCVHEDHFCDPVVTHTYDDKGNVTSTTTTYSDCPMYTMEYSFYVLDNLGRRHDVVSHGFAERPVRWRSDILVSGIADVPRGTPPLWQELKRQIDAGDLPPIALPDLYDNIILGSKSGGETSDNIKDLVKDGLLPPHTMNMDHPFHDQFRVDKMTFVGNCAWSNTAVWQDYLMRFDAMFGSSDTHGDLHVVAMCASSLPQSITPDEYIDALSDHWLYDFGKNAFPKNAVALAIGVSDDGKSVVWGRAITGMPTGNSEMLRALQYRLSGTATSPLAFDPDTILGKTTAKAAIDEAKKPYVEYTMGNGIVPQIIMTDFRFKRACMRCEDPDEKDQVGYISLESLIPINTTGIWLAILAMLVLSGGLTWGAMAFYRYRVGCDYVFTRGRRSRFDPYDSVSRRRRVWSRTRF